MGHSISLLYSRFNDVNSHRLIAARRCSCLECGTLEEMNSSIALQTSKSYLIDKEQKQRSVCAQKSTGVYCAQKEHNKLLDTWKQDGIMISDARNDGGCARVSSLCAESSKRYRDHCHSLYHHKRHHRAISHNLPADEPSSICTGIVSRDT